MIEFFAEMKVVNVGVGMNHSVFIVKEKDSKEKSVYACGECTNNKLC